jgi:hypothetical protein
MTIPSTGWLERRLTPEGVELLRARKLQSGDLLVPPEWLPASAWEDQTIRAFVPFRYAACLGANVPDHPIEQLLALLPAPAADLLRGRQTVPHNVPNLLGPAGCLALTTEDARLLASTLSDAGLEHDEEHEGRYAYFVDGDVSAQGGEGLAVYFEPVFPDGATSCTECG